MIPLPEDIKGHLFEAQFHCFNHNKLLETHYLCLKCGLMINCFSNGSFEYLEEIPFTLSNLKQIPFLSCEEMMIKDIIE
jgi:hypothetical protein